jgi:nucleoside-diphosphate-sugar epimerase
MTRRLAAVTGATGFLGKRLVPALIADGWDVRALVRRPRPAGLWGGASPQTVQGDVGDPAALAALAQGAQVVIHAAGLIKARTLADFMAVNADGARNVAAAAQGAGARMLMISSLAAREPALSHYAASKRAGETAARQILGEALTVVRPPAVYGPGDRETLSLFKLAGGVVVPLPGPAAARLALIHVDDALAAVLALLDQPDAAGVYALGGARPQGYGWREIFQTGAAAIGARPRLLAVPTWTIRAAGAISQAVGRLGGGAPIFTSGKAREVLHLDWAVTPAEQAPGAPTVRYDLAAGFAHAVAWYRTHGWLD